MFWKPPSPLSVQAPILETVCSEGTPVSPQTSDLPNLFRRPNFFVCVYLRQTPYSRVGNCQQNLGHQKTLTSSRNASDRLSVSCRAPVGRSRRLHSRKCRLRKCAPVRVRSPGKGIPGAPWRSVGAWRPFALPPRRGRSWWSGAASRASPARSRYGGSLGDPSQTPGGLGRSLCGAREGPFLNIIPFSDRCLILTVD